jgi:hypothetical protein
LVCLAHREVTIAARPYADGEADGIAHCPVARLHSIVEVVKEKDIVGGEQVFLPVAAQLPSTEVVAEQRLDERQILGVGVVVQ